MRRPRINARTALEPLLLILEICALVGLILMMDGCKATRTIEVPVVTVLRDTIQRGSVRVDSLYVRDSVYVEAGHTYKERVIYNTKLQRDTAYVVRCDTVPVPRYIDRVVPAAVPWYDTVSIYAGRGCIIALLLWLLFLYLRRKK